MLGDTAKNVATAAGSSQELVHPWWFFFYSVGPIGIYLNQGFTKSACDISCDMFNLSLCICQRFL